MTSRSTWKRPERDVARTLQGKRILAVYRSICPRLVQASRLHFRWFRVGAERILSRFQIGLMAVPTRSESD